VTLITSRRFWTKPAATVAARANRGVCVSMRTQDWYAAAVAASQHVAYRLQADGSLAAPASGVDPVAAPRKAFVRAFMQQLTPLLRGVSNGDGGVGGHSDGGHDDEVVGGSSGAGRASDTSSADTWVVPTMQLGSVGLKQVRLLPKRSWFAGCLAQAKSLFASSGVEVEIVTTTSPTPSTLTSRGRCRGS